MSDPYKVVRDFEAALCEYTGAPYAVTTTSCTMALLLAVAWHLRMTSGTTGRPMLPSWAPEMRQKVEIPARTYVSVPQSIIHAGGWPTFREEDWSGAYQLRPLPVWDSARWLTGGHYRMVCERLASETGQFVCLSFHASKTLGDTQGGCVLHDDPEADAWLRRARFDGRTEGVPPHKDRFTQIGWHAYMSPDVAARLLLKLRTLPRHNDPLPNDNYPDLSQMDIFR